MAGFTVSDGGVQPTQKCWEAIANFSKPVSVTGAMEQQHGHLVGAGPGDNRGGVGQDTRDGQADMFGHIFMQNRVGVLVSAARLFEEALLCARTLEVGVGRVQVPEGGQDKVLGIGHGVRDGTVQDVLAGVPSPYFGRQGIGPNQEPESPVHELEDT